MATSATNSAFTIMTLAGMAGLSLLFAPGRSALLERCCHKAIAFDCIIAQSYNCH